MTVDLPPFPGGSTADAINDNCLVCHFADMLLNQPEAVIWIGSIRVPIAVGQRHCGAPAARSS